MNAPLYIHACDMLTPIGLNRKTTAAAQAAGISNFKASTYLNAQHTLINMALVPQTALPEADVFLELLAELTPWEYHLIRLAHAPLSAVWPIGYSAAIPILVVLPELHPRGSAAAPAEFIALLTQQTQLPICPTASQLLPLGRAGFMAALRQAQQILQQGNTPFVLVGGVDSYQQERLLVNVDADGRLSKTDGPSDGFIPGEGAAWLLLSLQPNTTGLAITACELDDEPGHLYSDAPYRGEALARALQTALMQPLTQPIRQVYNSANGERYWAKELGVMLTRNQAALVEQPQHHHPADCWGDLGAATGPALAALAVTHCENSKQVLTAPILTSCASDQGLRGIALLTHHAQA
ncbi:MAG TPA: beta-ketoacyl synthase N-terminal-like domain-containing protein [Cellvibrionaceae bacterium]